MLSRHISPRDLYLLKSWGKTYQMMANAADNSTTGNHIIKCLRLGYLAKIENIIIAKQTLIAEVKYLVSILGTTASTNSIQLVLTVNP